MLIPRRYCLAVISLFVVGLLNGCQGERSARVAPVVVTDRVPYDTDDPAIWVDPSDSTHVIVVGTDKGSPSGLGGLYAFDLQGKIIGSVKPLDRANNVDVAYLSSKSGIISVAVCTERARQQLRVFRLPDL